MIERAFFGVFNWFANNPAAQFMAAVAAIFAGFKLIKREGAREERQKQKTRDAEAAIKINETLNEMREAENDLADKAQDAGRNPGPSASDELRDPIDFQLTFGRPRREGEN